MIFTVIFTLFINCSYCCANKSNLISVAALCCKVLTELSVQSNYIQLLYIHNSRALSVAEDIDVGVNFRGDGGRAP